ncbi:MAG: hypothetical protein JWQ79_952 [Mucilaginibacter sp.]|nr:hypothetical protein [Mucilaginibacter sp.]
MEYPILITSIILILIPLMDSVLKDGLNWNKFSWKIFRSQKISKVGYIIITCSSINLVSSAIKIVTDDKKTSTMEYNIKQISNNDDSIRSINQKILKSLAKNNIPLDANYNIILTNNFNNTQKRTYIERGNYTLIGNKSWGNSGNAIGIKAGGDAEPNR